MVDTHAHIYHKRLLPEIEQVMQRCTQQNVHKVYMPNIDHESIDDMLQVEQAFPERCFAMMGVHPCSVNPQSIEKELQTVESWLQKRPFVAVGEMGLDLYWDKTTLEAQKEAFRVQANWAKDLGLPIVIHCRDAFEPTIELVEELQDGRLKGIFHCWVDGLEEAQRTIEAGFLIGLGGVSTFKNGGLGPVMQQIDLQHIVLETDSPFLAPVPHRGKRNEPAYVALVAQTLANAKGISIDEVDQVTTQNAFTLFKK